MSTIEANPEVEDVPVSRKNDHEVTAARNAQVGGLAVRRLLPLRTRRSVGGWCFIDHYGPADTDGRTGMNVPPHPHIGLQTVTWLLRGNVLHRDSLGSEQLIRPGQLNLMTSGRGIAHAEESVTPGGRSRPRAARRAAVGCAARRSRHVAPGFEHHAVLPQTTLPKATRAQPTRARRWRSRQAPRSARASPWSSASSRAESGHHVLAYRRRGVHGGARPARNRRASAAAGLRARDLRGERAGRGRRRAAVPGQLLYLPTGLETAVVAARGGTTLFLLGGVPLGEQLLMWWNFVARTPDEIAAATTSWAPGSSGRWAVIGRAAACSRARRREAAPPALTLPPR